MLVAIMFAINGQSVQKTIKELEEQVPRLSGKAKVDVLNRLSEIYFKISSEKILEYGERALKLSGKLKYEKGKAVALRNVAIGYAKSGQLERSLENSLASLVIFKRLGEKREIADSSNTVGCVYYSLGNYKKALEYHREALKIRQEMDNKIDMAASFGNIGVVYSAIGQYDKALEYQLKALRIRLELDDKLGISVAFNSLGTIYSRLRDNDKALEYFLKSLKIKEEIGYRFGMVSSLEGIGKIYTELKDYDRALKFLLRSLRLKEEIGDKRRISSSLSSIGDIYLSMKDFDKALEYYTHSLKIEEKIGDELVLSASLNKIGLVHIKLKEFNKALFFLNKSLKIARRINANETIKSVYFNLSDLYVRQGDYRSALKYYKLYAKTNDEIFNENSSRQIAEMQTRFETLEKEKEIEILKKNNRIQQLIVNRQKLIRNVAVIVSMLLLIIFFQFFKKYRYLFSFWKKRNFIAHYKLLGRMGSGGMGNIYRARDIQNKSRICAIKLLKDEYYRDEQYKRRFKNEAALIDQLSHPNIVRVMERGESEGNLYIAMELLDGQTLAHFLSTHEDFDLPVCLKIMIQMADALTEIHKRGIVHRDLKPENIMIVHTEENPMMVKLLDFGLARLQSLTRLTRTGMIMGTIYYVAPEQLSGARVSSASDVYSLGVIFYQVLTREKPFSGDTAFAIARQIFRKDPEDIHKIRPEIPPSLNTLVKTMIAKDPSKRPAAAAALSRLKDIEKSIEK